MCIFTLCHMYTRNFVSNDSPNLSVKVYMVWSNYHLVLEIKTFVTEIMMKSTIISPSFRSSRPEVSYKKRYSKKFRKIYRKTPNARVSFLIKLQAWHAILLKKRLWHRCFPVNFAKFLRITFLKDHPRWLLLILF